MKKIFVINGVARSGKDTFVDIVSNRVYSVKNISTVTDIKEIATKHFGYCESRKNDRDRKFLSDLKELTSWYCDFSFAKTVDSIEKSCNKIFFIHCREPRNIDRFKNYFTDKEKYSFKTIMITRNTVNTPNNMSDNGVNDYVYDYYIENNGSLDEYEEKVAKFAFVNIVNNNNDVTLDTLLTKKLDKIPYLGNISVTVDYDKTLTRKDVRKYVKNLISLGVDVWILTRRYSDLQAHNYPQNPSNFDLWNTVSNIGLPKHKVIFTCMENKSNYLSKTDVLWHLDDMLEEDISTRLSELGSKTKCISVTKSGTWRQKCNNLILKRLC